MTWAAAVQEALNKKAKKKRASANKKKKECSYEELVKIICRNDYYRHAQI